jgi:hypothetical protein
MLWHDLGVCSMDTIICEHCLQPTAGKVYRVTSEDAGVVTLNLVVCSACCREAEKLGLKTSELDSAARAPMEFDRNDYRR